VINTVLLVAAFVLFVLGAIPTPSRINLVSAGLACWALTLLIGRF
jgi:hypothetical protein